MSTRVRVEELPTDKPRTRVLKVEVTDEALQQGLRQIARAISRQIQIPGFRPGKAPYELVERRVGRTVLLREFLEQNIENLLAEALQQQNLSPAYPVEFLRLELDPPLFEVEVPLEPEVELGDYLNVRVPYEEPEVTDDEVEEVIREHVLRPLSTWEAIDEPIAEGDRVEAQLTIQVGEKRMESNTEVTLDIREGAEYYLPGLVEQLIGLKSGEEKTFTLPVPEQHPWREHGEEATVTVKVHTVQRERLPELTPEVLEQISTDAETVEELRDIIRQNLEHERREHYRREYLDKVFQALKERGVKVTYPPLLLERMLEQYIKELQRYAQRMGLTYEELLKAAKKTEEELREEARRDYAEALWRSLVVSEILQQQQVELRPEDLTEVATEYVLRYGVSAERFAELVQKDESLRDSLFHEALVRRGEDVLIAIARGEWETATEEASVPETTEEGHRDVKVAAEEEIKEAEEA